MHAYSLPVFRMKAYVSKEAIHANGAIRNLP